MEYLDYYDEHHSFLGTESRELVHKNGLWHNTVHCWLYDKFGNVYFQIRKDENKFYTTASGHVLAGETIKEAFGREIKEEIGINIDYEKASLIDTVVWQMDKIKNDSTIIKDRAFANVNIFEINDSDYKFKFDENEVIGIVKVNAKDALKLFENGKGTILAEIINKNNEKETTEVSFEDFLVNDHETAIGKYGLVLEKIIEKINY